MFYLELLSFANKALELSHIRHKTDTQTHACVRADTETQTRTQTYIDTHTQPHSDATHLVLVNWSVIFLVILKTFV